MRTLSLLLVVAALSLVTFLAPAALEAQGTAPFVRTVVVNSGGTPAANGTALQLALFSITTNSATNPWLVKVEPGIYDLGAGQLVMKTFVDIEGSGRNATFIRSTISGTNAPNGTVYVPPTANAELRGLTVQNFSPGDGVGIGNESDELKLTQVNIEVEAGARAYGYLNGAGDARLSAVFPRVVGGTGVTFGVDIRGGGPIINEMFILVDGAGTSVNSTAVRVLSDSAPVMEQIFALVSNASKTSQGIRLEDEAVATVTNCRFTALGNDQSLGVFMFDASTLELRDCEVEAISPGSLPGVGALHFGRELKMTNTAAFGTSDGVVTESGSFTEIRNSIVGGNRSLRTIGTGTSLVGASQLDGPVSTDATATVTCVGAYDGAYAPLGPTC